MTINALSASNSVIIPIQCEFFALEGLAQLLNTVKLVRKSINPKFSSQNNLSKQVFADLSQHFKGKLFKDSKDKYIVVPRNVKLAEAPSFGKPAILYDVKSVGSIAYQNLAQTIIS
jgi:chromosome partitioning protein